MLICTVNGMFMVIIRIKYRFNKLHRPILRTSAHDISPTMAFLRFLSGQRICVNDEVQHLHYWCSGLIPGGRTRIGLYPVQQTKILVQQVSNQLSELFCCKIWYLVDLPSITIYARALIITAVSTVVGFPLYFITPCTYICTVIGLPLYFLTPCTYIRPLIRHTCISRKHNTLYA